MPRHPRARRAVKWTMTVAAVVMAGAWVGSVRFAGMLVHARGHDDTLIGVMAGCAVVTQWDGVYEASMPGNFHFSGRWQQENFVWWWPWLNRDGPQYTSLAVPLWMPLVLLGVPAGQMWRTDRRPLPGQCRCGYNLAGLDPAAACPECGAKAARV